jgi:acetolactate synthase-1/2/3 large subunit
MARSTDLAIGYTAFTGKMQAVMLHTGVGLLQGAMGIDAAQRQGIPMLVMSGEALSYGEQKGFDPGPQWAGMLSVVGGTHRLAEPVTKFCTQVTSPETLYVQMVRAGEIAQRAPTGPSYVCVPIETMIHPWEPPAHQRKVPPAPKPQASPSDIEKVADLLLAAKNPLILTESAGREPEGQKALIELAELLSIPVVNTMWADYANIPHDHPLYQGFMNPPLIQEADVVLLARSRTPWYPPKARPPKATIIAIDEAPQRPSMVYQNTQADMFLEGDMVANLKLLATAVRAGKVGAAKVKERREKYAASNKKLADELRAVEEKAAAKKTIDPTALVAALGKSLPKDAIFVDETITHRGHLLKQLPNTTPQSYFRIHGGLGQGLGVALGIRLANPKRPVVSVIGDGSFMYNPITQSLALSKHAELPIMMVVFNNNGYRAMKLEHQTYYPDGVAQARNIFYGEPVTDFEYSELVKPFGGYGCRVETPVELGPALKEGLAAVKDGKMALLNVALDS